jgi:peptidylprolyl isomerase
MKHIFCGIFLLALAASAQAQAKRPARAGKAGIAAVEAELRKLESEWFAAVVNKDEATIKRIFADDILTGNDDGSWLTKADMLAMTKAGVPIDKLTSDEFKLRLYGTTAIVNGKSSYYSNGRKLGQNHHTAVWLKRNARWQVVVWQSTPITNIKLLGAKAVTTASGLQYEDIVVGTGASPKAGQIVRVHYTGWLIDGTKFDSSMDHSGPLPFPIGIGRVIKGWDEGVLSMKVGGKRKLVIPPQLGYGANGMGPIPPNATLVFEVELVGIE